MSTEGTLSFATGDTLVITSSDGKQRAYRVKPDGFMEKVTVSIALWEAVSASGAPRTRRPRD